MFTAVERIPAQELAPRHDRCRAHLRTVCPDVGGLLVFSRLNIYYFTGTFGNGLFWLPLEGEPVLLLRKGVERAELESAVSRILPFRSFSDLPGLLADAGSPLSGKVAVEATGITWSLGMLLARKLPGFDLVPGEKAITLARNIKTPWELNKLALAGERHGRGLRELLPGRIEPGMTEREVGLITTEIFSALGHCGYLRMSALGEDMYFGNLAAGDSGIYPTGFDGPVGMRGVHPSLPFMGNAGKVWRGDEHITVDCGFCLEGYHTDKTHIYWPGSSLTLPAELAAAHDFCEEVQAWLAERLRPGEIPSELYAGCLEMADKAGFSEGFMGLGGNKVRFVGHGIGLCIDEYPALAKGFDQPLEENMVLALEPKMGVPGKGMVGVENTFQVTGGRRGVHQRPRLFAHLSGGPGQVSCMGFPVSRRVCSPSRAQKYVGRGKGRVILEFGDGVRRGAGVPIQDIRGGVPDQLGASGGAGAVKAVVFDKGGVEASTG